MTVGTFACILSMRQGGRLVEGIEDLKGLSRSDPMMALALAIFMFSMAGIPPLAGFFGKLFVFLAAIDAGLFGLAVVGVLASVFGAFYYLRIIKFMYFDEPEESFDKPIGRETGAILILTSLIIVGLWALPGTIIAGATQAAATFGG